MFGAWIRRTAFWALDSIKGGKVKAHYRDIEAKMTGKKGIEDSLNEILSYTEKNVPYYQGKGYKKLEDFPVITKKDIMASYESFCSTQFQNRDELHEVSTSGSSGNPFHAFQNADKRNRVIAELLYVHNCINWNLGDKYVFMRAWTAHYNNMRFQQFKQNFIPIEVTGFDTNQMEKMRQMLKKDRKIKVVIGYSSSLSEFAKYIDAQGDTPEMYNLKVIVADSDTLTPDGKATLEKVFGIPIISRYDNEEQGILAYTKPWEDEYIVNCASYYVEILDMNGDYPAKPGETGRIVVTDMYNKAMGFIRYDTGDLAIAGEVENGRCMTIKALQGRVADVVYATDGNTVHSPTVNNYICDFFDIKKYQLIQKEKDVFELYLVCDASSESVAKVEENMKLLLGADAQIIVHTVADIPAGKNGKFKTVVNEMIG